MMAENTCFTVEARPGRTRRDVDWNDVIGDCQSFQEHWRLFQKMLQNRKPDEGPPVVWRPGPEQFTNSNLALFMQAVGVEDYAALHRWSVENRPAFWRSVVERLRIHLNKAPKHWLAPGKEVRDPDWFAGAELNCVDSCFSGCPDQLAIISLDEGARASRALTYGELERLVNRVANGLKERGFKPGEPIAIYMPMTIECVAAYLGVIKSGCVVVSVADSFSANELRKRMEIAAADCVLTVDKYSRGGKAIDLYGKVKASGAGRAIVVREQPGAPANLRNGDLTWDDFISEKDSFDSLVTEPGRVTNILFSSGTTAEPKAIPWTHLTPLKCAMDGHFHQDIHEQDVIAWPTNIGWMMGPWLIFATFINQGSMALFQGAPTGKAFADFIQIAGVTVLGVIPSMVRAWRSSGVFSNHDFERVRLFSSTGEPSNREDYLWLMSLANYRAPVIEYLGGTEIGGGHLTGAVVQNASPAMFTTPALGTDFCILDEDGRPVKEGETGELFLIPPALGLSQKLLNLDHEQVYYTGVPSGPNGEILRRHGDHISRLHDGFYAAQGRADDAMNLGGIKISSVELEQVINAHACVEESAAVAIQPDGEGQEKLVVFVVTKMGSGEDKLRAELGKMVATALNPLFKLYDLVCVKQLPRTASNKLMRRELRASYARTNSES